MDQDTRYTRLGGARVRTPSNGNSFMKLTSEQITAVERVLGAGPIEDENPAMESLRNIFGDHTFYIGEEGLFSFEPDQEAQDGAADPIRLILIAGWTDENRNQLQPVEPQATNVVIDASNPAPAEDLGSQGDGAA